jgi:excisionase family DNA binding protein
VTERLFTYAELLAVSKTWILESARSGAMPCIRLGRYVRFNAADVEAWPEECKRSGRGHRLEAKRRTVPMSGEAETQPGRRGTSRLGPSPSP